MSMAENSAAFTTPTAANRTPLPDGPLDEKVSVRGLNFYYGDNRALKTVNVPLYAGLVTAFIGPSGCGKSTLLRVLNRIYDLYPRQRAEGIVLLDNENILNPNLDLNLLRARGMPIEAQASRKVSGTSTSMSSVVRTTTGTTMTARATAPAQAEKCPT